MKVFNKKNLKNVVIFTGGILTMFVITCVIGIKASKEDEYRERTVKEFADKIQEKIDLKLQEEA